jgi:protein SCO1
LTAAPLPLASPPVRHRGLVWLWGTVALAGTLTAGWALWRSSHREPPPAVFSALPDFSLTDQLGRTVTRDSLAGRAWVADFIFTSCAGACPAMTGRVARLQGQLPPDTALVSITVDPAHDTPEILARYAASANAGPGWLFLTGDRDAIYRLATDGFKLAALEVPADERRTGDDGPFLHSSKLVLVDGKARVRGYYDSTDEAAVQRLLAELARVGTEARP